MTAEQYLSLKKDIKKLNTKDLISMVEERLNLIKEVLIYTKMIVLEIQVRKEK